MQVAKDKVISIHYTLTNLNGDVIDKSAPNEPLIYLHGAGNIIPGLENALTGKETGDKLNVTVPPEQAYGERRENMVQTVDRSMFGGIETIETGMQFHADGNTGPVVVTVTKIEGDDITIDGNHPLAGETLTFDVEIEGVREATADELSHGHIHGPGCNH
ncbi:MAG: FKBP-type peptidyl-prolyl cis-trans isomerase [Gammaproteobacteria bacterium]